MIVGLYSLIFRDLISVMEFYLIARRVFVAAGSFSVDSLCLVLIPRAVQMEGNRPTAL